MQVWASVVEKTVNLNDAGTRKAVQVWFRPELRDASGRAVWQGDHLVNNGLVARGLAREVLNSGLLPAMLAAA